ncbi:AAA family ATPase [Clostridium sporogenes]|uniref:AAA family ATPase n=1 Tax=Clostridium sporogenes TaxID=1509 RepID=UPI002238CDCF|nr:AAA family ATPase [Clostridium sporogenes]MCW6088161.1 AAA family ATPase [Clostridium sporogenes]
MKELGIKSKNPMNDGYVYSLILHSEKIKELWDKGIDIPEHMHEGTVNLDSEEAGEVGKIHTELYIKNDFLNDVFISEKQYDTLEILLKRKKNIILQGAPGVGKTYAAKRLAYSIMGKKDDSCIKLIQFHQSYSYEDFIMGYRPDDRGVSIKYGTFYEFQKKAKENPDKKFFLIIDEINRGNLSKIFGELFMLIEADKRGEKIVLTYNDEEFYVPENLYIIGTMNTADRSLAIIDYALRRRFCFFELVPAFATQEFKQYLLGNNVDKDLIEKIIIRFSHLNSEIEKDPNLGSGFRIGHSYFCDCSGTNDLWYETIIKYEIAPLLEEYWFDDIENAKNHIEELLR